MDSQSIKQKIQQIQKDLNDAVSLMTSAKKELVDLEASMGVMPSKNIPGVVGKFMGDCMVTEGGQKYDVPLNYASKSVLVFGDTLKMYEEGGEKKFKQIERVKRFRTEGILAKKEGKWHAVTSDSSYRVLDTSVNHFGAVEGDMVVVLLPLNDKYVSFAAVESVVGKKVAVTENQAVAKPIEVKPVEKVEYPSIDHAPVVFQSTPHIEAVAADAPTGEIELVHDTSPSIEEIKGGDDPSTVVRSTPSKVGSPTLPKAPIVKVVARPVVVSTSSGGRSNNFKKKKNTDVRKVTPTVVRVAPSEVKKVVVVASTSKPSEAPAPEPSRVLDDEDLR